VTVGAGLGETVAGEAVGEVVGDTEVGIGVTVGTVVQPSRTDIARSIATLPGRLRITSQCCAAGRRLARTA
jgi:hypothetical protein